MKGMWIDFKQPVAPLLRMLRAALLVCGVLALGFSIMRQQQVSAEKTALSWQMQNVSRLEARKLPMLHAPADTNIAQDASKRANEVLRQLNLPWDRLFSAMEKSVTPEIGILSIAPAPNKASISLKAAAPDTEAAIDFMERLQTTKLLTNVHLTSQEITEDSKRQPLQFTLTAGWGTSP
jgi:Tfp pilus assembly protein PilN